MGSSYTPQLVTPVSVANGGTGQATAPLALAALGGQAKVQNAYKATATNRASDNTYSDDPDLTYAIPVTGRYHVRAFISTKFAAGTPGIKARMNFTGTRALVCGTLQFIGVIAANVLTPDFGGTDVLFAGQSRTEGEVGYLFDFEFTASTTGTLSVQWAQLNSETDATTVQAGAWMRVLPL